MIIFGADDMPLRQGLSAWPMRESAISARLALAVAAYAFSFAGHEILGARREGKASLPLFLSEWRCRRFIIYWGARQGNTKNFLAGAVCASNASRFDGMI